MTTNKNFKIAKIVDDTTFIITGGARQEIEEGEYFNIIQPDEFEVIDPDTGSALGSYKLIKGKIIAETVYDNFTICRTETYTDQISSGGLNGITNILAQKSETVTLHKRLDVNEDDITGGLTPEPISVGDIVEKMSAPQN